MNQQRRIVRVVLPDGVNDLTTEVRGLLDCLKYAGLIVMHRDDRDGVCFDVLPPQEFAGRDEQWARDAAAYFRAGAYNAVVAPECPPDEETWSDKMLDAIDNVLRDGADRIRRGG